VATGTIASTILITLVRLWNSKWPWVKASTGCTWCSRLNLRVGPIWLLCLALAKKHAFLLVISTLLLRWFFAPFS